MTKNDTPLWGSYFKKGQVDLNSLGPILQERNAWPLRPHMLPFKEAFESSPDLNFSHSSVKGNVVTVDQAPDFIEKYDDLQRSLKGLIPWKKGPFQFQDIQVDSEWRSDLKWERLEAALGDQKGKKVLDIGCNNGYFLFKMKDMNPALLLGIDPVPLCLQQFNLVQKYLKSPHTFFELLGVEHVPYFKNAFDTILSMGIVYHHRNPIAQLVDIREALVPGGTAIFETIGIPGESAHALFPEDRYAKMKNVWFIPTLSCFKNWIHKSRFTDIEVISDTDLTSEEQRLTPWCPPPHQSLSDFLNPNDPSLTIEGHPAPRRFMIKAKKKGG